MNVNFVNNRILLGNTLVVETLESPSTLELAFLKSSLYVNWNFVNHFRSISSLKSKVTEGYTYQRAISRQDLGGDDITRHMIKLLSDEGIPFKDTSSDFLRVSAIKEKHAYVLGGGYAPSDKYPDTYKSLR